MAALLSLKELKQRICMYTQAQVTLKRGGGTFLLLFFVVRQSNSHRDYEAIVLRGNEHQRIRLDNIKTIHEIEDLSKMKLSKSELAAVITLWNESLVLQVTKRYLRSSKVAPPETPTCIQSNRNLEERIVSKLTHWLECHQTNKGHTAEIPKSSKHKMEATAKLLLFCLCVCTFRNSS